jgi:dedicator of cytokinesis protein 9/10/11
MKSNFEFSGRKALTRVHLQVIISVSQMMGSIIGINNSRFQESISLINSYASRDGTLKASKFLSEVKDLTKRVRTVLMATQAMQSHQTDPERLAALQLSLANSYASTPELRHTWLVTIAKNHEFNNNISEAAMCHLHIAALIAEYLKLRGDGLTSFGSENFEKISRNIPKDERGLKLDSGIQDSQYNENVLLDQLKLCAIFLDRAERLECLGEVYRMIIPLLERKKDFGMLVEGYKHLAQAYQRVIEFNLNGKRLLGTFFRVVHYSQIYFDEDHAVEYVYKEPKVTSLSEISMRLKKQYEDKFGFDVVRIIMDSNQVNLLKK